MLLQSFRVEQSGKDLRMIDSDGSVYLGSIESSTRNASTLNFKREVLAQSAKLAGETKSVNQTGQMFRFRVAGTNLTLNQPMVFTGNILNNVAPGSNAPASNAPASNGGAFAPAGQVSPRLDQSQLSGQVLLGLTNRIDILAVPAKQ